MGKLETILRSIDWIYLAAVAFVIVSGVLALIYIPPTAEPKNHGERSAVQEVQPNRQMRSAKGDGARRDEMRSPAGEGAQREGMRSQADEVTQDGDARFTAKPFHSSVVPFDLAHPDRSYALPSELKEVSGVAVSSDASVAWAVNDEQATLYRIDLKSGSVETGQTFAQPGDYEGVELVDDTVIAVRSDGTLWRVSSEEAKKVESPLAYSHDVEGLALDERNSRILVACKGKAGRHSRSKHAKAIYAVELPEYRWTQSPVFEIQRDALHRFLEAWDVTGRARKAAKSFAPSGIAVDPITQHVYVLSSAGKMLVVLDPEGDNIVDVVALSRDVHSQPEGLDFDAAGSLYVSNEGRGSRATLHRFDRDELLAQ